MDVLLVIGVLVVGVCCYIIFFSKHETKHIEKHKKYRKLRKWFFRKNGK